MTLSPNYTSQVQSWASRSVSGPLRSVAEEDLANASTDPKTIGIAAVGCDPKLSVTSCTGLPRPWRMRRVYGPLSRRRGTVAKRWSAANCGKQPVGESRTPFLSGEDDSREKICG